MRRLTVVAFLILTMLFQCRGLLCEEGCTVTVRAIVSCLVTHTSRPYQVVVRHASPCIRLSQSHTYRVLVTGNDKTARARHGHGA